MLLFESPQTVFTKVRFFGQPRFTRVDEILFNEPPSVKSGM